MLNSNGNNIKDKKTREMKKRAERMNEARNRERFTYEKVAKNKHKILFARREVSNNNVQRKKSLINFDNHRCVFFDSFSSR